MHALALNVADLPVVATKLSGPRRIERSANRPWYADCRTAGRPATTQSSVIATSPLFVTPPRLSRRPNLSDHRTRDRSENDKDQKWFCSRRLGARFAESSGQSEFDWPAGKIAVFASWSFRSRLSLRGREELHRSYSHSTGNATEEGPPNIKRLLNVRRGGPFLKPPRSDASEPKLPPVAICHNRRSPWTPVVRPLPGTTPNGCLGQIPAPIAQ
jgi:hypothetical protein